MYKHFVFETLFFYRVAHIFSLLLCFSFYFSHLLCVSLPPPPPTINIFNSEQINWIGPLRVLWFCANIVCLNTKQIQLLMVSNELCLTLFNWKSTINWCEELYIWCMYVSMSSHTPRIYSMHIHSVIGTLSFFIHCSFESVNAMQCKCTIWLTIFCLLFLYVHMVTIDGFTDYVKYDTVCCVIGVDNKLIRI